MVLKYVEKILALSIEPKVLQSHIGVITPYMRQVNNTTENIIDIYTNTNIFLVASDQKQTTTT